MINLCVHTLGISEGELKSLAASVRVRAAKPCFDPAGFYGPLTASYNGRIFTHAGEDMIDGSNGCMGFGASRSEGVPITPWIVGVLVASELPDAQNKTIGLHNWGRVIQQMASSTAAWDWFNKVIDEDREGKPVRALNVLFGAVDKLLAAEEYGEVDAWLESLVAKNLSVNLRVGILSITRQASERLPFREKFLADAWTATESDGRDARKLFGALKGRASSNGESARTQIPIRIRQGRNCNLLFGATYWSPL